jgi:hypothetical protein
LYYKSLLQWWQLVMILVKTNHPYLRGDVTACTLLMLVTLCATPHLVLFILIMSCMFPLYKEILFLSIVSLEITMFLWNNILTSFWLRTHSRGMCFYSKCRWGLYPFPSLEQSSTKCAFSVVRPLINHWHHVLVIPPWSLSRESWIIKSCPFQRSLVQLLCVMHANVPRVISYPSLLRLVCRKHPLNLCFWMCGGLPQVLSVNIATM